MFGNFCIFLVLQSLVFSGGCSAFKSNHDMVINKGMQGKTVSVKPSQKFSIELDENPTTGYRWELTSPEGSPVEVQADTYSAKAGGALGSGGKRHFDLAIKDKGNYPLGFVLVRSWNKAEAADRFDVTVTVE